MACQIRSNLFRERQDKSLRLQYFTRFKNPLYVWLLVRDRLELASVRTVYRLRRTHKPHR